MIVELAFALALVQAPPAAGVTHDLEQIEQDLAATWKKGDCAGWGARIAPEWSVIHVDGNVMTRAEALTRCEARDVPIETATIDEVSVRAFGDAAVVTGRTTMTTGGAQPVTVRLRFTDVFIRRGGRWQAVASQATRLGS